MNIFQWALRRIAVRNVDRAIVKSFKSVVNKTEADKIGDYVPKIPKLTSVFKSFGMSVLILLGSAVWVGALYLILKIFLSSDVSFLISNIVISVLLVLSMLEIWITTDIPGVDEKDLYVNDARYKSGQRFVRKVKVPSIEHRIIFTKTQRTYNIISCIIEYIPSLINLWTLYFIIV